MCGKTETCGLNDAALVTNEVVSNQVLPEYPLLSRLLMKPDCYRSVLGESGRFFFDSLFSDDH